MAKSIDALAYILSDTASPVLATEKYVNDNLYTDEKAQDAIGGILTDGGGIDWTYDDATPKITAKLVDIKTVHYHAYIAASNTNILNGKSINVSGGNYTESRADVPDVPRTVDWQILNMDVSNALVGTFDISGKDCNGNTSKDSFSINIAKMGAGVGVGTIAFTVITAISFQTTSGTTLRLSMGWASLMGLPNYPFTSSTQLIHANKYSTTTTPTFNTTNGTITWGAIASGDIYTVLIKSG